jgi:Protein of unknown function (DUF4239)
MLTVTEDIIVIVVTVACSLLAMLALNRFWPLSQRRIHNDLIGWQLTVLGTTYAVIIGFMLYTVWTDYGAASSNATQEASQIVKLNRLAAGLPEPQQSEMRSLSIAYTNAVLDREWAEMAQGRVATESNELSRKMWHSLMSIKGGTYSETNAVDHSLYELSTLMASRQARQLAVTSKLPAILWVVLVMGGVLTLLTACMFGQENLLLHGIHVFAFSLLIALVLVAIADIDRPYMGTVHVDDIAFRRALIDMQP